MIGVDITVEDDHLMLKASGDFDINLILEHMHRVVLKASIENRTRVLIDALSLSAPRADFHRYLVGKQLAEVLPPDFRIAVLYPEAHITKLAENAAVNRGAQLLVTHDREEALRWLRSKD